MPLFANTTPEQPRGDAARAKPFFDKARTVSGEYRLTMQAQGLAADPYNALEMRNLLAWSAEAQRSGMLVEAVRKSVKDCGAMGSFIQLVMTSVQPKGGVDNAVTAAEQALAMELKDCASVLAEHAHKILVATELSSGALKSLSLKIAAVYDGVESYAKGLAVIDHAIKLCGFDSELDRCKQSLTVKGHLQADFKEREPEAEIADEHLPVLDPLERAKVEYEAGSSVAHALQYVHLLVEASDIATAKRVLRDTYRRGGERKVFDRASELELAPHAKAFTELKHIQGIDQNDERVKRARQVYAQTELQFCKEWCHEFKNSAEAKLRIAQLTMRSTEPTEIVDYLQQALRDAKQADLINDINLEMARAFTLAKSYTEAICIARELVSAASAPKKENEDFHARASMVLGEALYQRALLRRDLGDAKEAEGVLALIRIRNVKYSGVGKLRQLVENFLQNPSQSDPEGAEAS